MKDTWKKYAGFTNLYITWQVSNIMEIEPQSFYWIPAESEYSEDCLLVSVKPQHHCRTHGKLMNSECPFTGTFFRFPDVFSKTVRDLYKKGGDLLQKWAWSMNKNDNKGNRYIKPQLRNSKTTMLRVSQTQSTINSLS